MTSPPLMNVNPLAPEILACPHAFNQQLREQAPVYHCPVTGIYFVSDYDNVVAIAKNEKHYFRTNLLNSKQALNKKKTLNLMPF